MDPGDVEEGEGEVGKGHGAPGAGATAQLQQVLPCHCATGRLNGEKMPSGVSLERGFTSNGILLQAVQQCCDFCIDLWWKGRGWERGCPPHPDRHRAHPRGLLLLPDQGQPPRAEPPRTPLPAPGKILYPCLKSALTRSIPEGHRLDLNTLPCGKTMGM